MTLSAAAAGTAEASIVRPIAATGMKVFIPVKA
jgi:hypothetical protein